MSTWASCLADEFWFWLVTMAVGLIAGGTAAFRYLHIARLIEDTPASRIRSAAQGYVELSGRGVPLNDAPSLAPLTQRPAVWWRYRIYRRSERNDRSGRHETWQQIRSGTSSAPFVLEDETGSCVVYPEGAELRVTESTTWYGDTPWPSAPPGDGLLRPTSRNFRYFEERIYEQEKIYALGEFRTRRRGEAEEREAAMASLLAQWKQDQPALVERFDKDGDGRIDLEEWELARQAAQRTVLESEHAEDRLARLNVLGRPAGGQLFLIATLPQGDLAKSYRRKALWACIGLFVGIYAFGWILQDAFNSRAQ